MRRLFIHTIWIVLVGLASGSAAAATAGQPIEDNDYSIELYVGPVLGSNRTISMAGAYVAVAEGAEGIAFNPASLAARWPYSHSWYDWDFSFDFYLAGFGARNDLDFDGTSRRGASGLLTGATSFQLGWWGMGATFLSRSIDFDLADGQRARSVLSQVAIAVARGMFDGRILAGVGVTWATFQLQLPDTKQTLINLESGTDGHLVGGLVWRPRTWPIRVGASFQKPVGGERLELPGPDADGVVRAEDRAVPSSIQVPGKLTLGVAISFGPRPFNPKWVNPRTETRPFTLGFEAERKARKEDHERRLTSMNDQEREAAEEAFEAAEEATQRKEDETLAALQESFVADAKRRHDEAPRQYFLLSVDLQIIEASGQPATGMDGFLAQRLDPVGVDATAQLRVGLETEPWHDVLRLRGGNYLEQSRFDAEAFRLHQTIGFDYHLWDYAEWLRFRVSGLVDVAPEYLNVGLSLGLWN